MRWRNTLISGGAAVGAAAIFNAMARRGVGPYENPIGGREGTYLWRGHQVAYTRRGAGAPLLLVHSIHAAASSFEWRRVVEPLAERHTVYTIDLLGFGLSARPAIRYSPRLYMSLIADFASHVVGEPVALVAASLSAAYAIALGARDPGRFPALVLIEPTGLARLTEPPSASGYATRLGVETPVLGTAVFNGLVSRASLRRWLERVYADDRLVTDALVEQYYRTAHQPGAKHAPAAFLGHQLDLDVRTAVRRLRQPALLVWGEQAELSPVEEVRGFLAANPGLELAIIDPAGDLPHDEQPRAFRREADAFLARHRVQAAPQSTPVPRAGTRTA